MTANEINIEAYKLIDLISVEPIRKSNESPDDFKDIAGVSEILEIDEVENFVESITDPYGFTVGRLIHHDNKRVGIKPDNYKLLRDLSVEILKLDNHSTYSDLDFIEQSFFNWIIDIYKTKRAKSDLISYIKECISSETFDYKFYFKIEALGIKKSFSVGIVEITYFDKESIENEYQLLNEKHNLSRKDFDDSYKEYFESVIASIKIRGVRKKAEKEAKREIHLSLNALKCLLIQESIQRHIQIFDVDFNYHNAAFSKFLARNCDSDTGLNINLSRKFGAAPIIIKEKQLYNYKKLGLNKFSEFLENKKNTELYRITEDSINHFGDMISTRDLYERTVKLISFFEGIVVPKSNNKAKGQGYLKKNVLSKLPYKDIEFLKPIITRYYNIRDKYLHNRIELPIDLNELFEIQKMGLVFLLMMVDFNKIKNELDDFLLFFDIK